MLAHLLMHAYIQTAAPICFTPTCCHNRPAVSQEFCKFVSFAPEALQRLLKNMAIEIVIGRIIEK